MRQALGVKNVPGGNNSTEGLLDQYAPWMNLQNAPTDQANMGQAEQRYLAMQGNPQLAQDASNLYASGQGGSSYGGAYLGQEQAMNNLNAFNAGLNQQQTDFQNVLNARNALYSQPIALGQQQNAADVARGLGVSGLDLQQTLGQNQYNLANAQGLNTYNLGANQIQNGYNSNIYGTQSGTYNAGLGAQANEFGTIGGIADASLGSLR